ncbi:MAG: UvrD-helicase domain-containing protein [Gammaproteobacteria bacterium]
MNSNKTPSALSTNASVHASAGSGKTYLLVSRLIRLLLLDVSPASILAITFTRKAAAEMHERMMERLYEISTADEQTLDSMLSNLELENTSTMKVRARQLFEKLLHDTRSVRVTTFHAFCQDLLRRFPFEADVPPGFELIDKTATLREEAWHSLMSEASSDKKPAIKSDLKILLQSFSPVQMHNLLDQFLSYRSDWWAYSQKKIDPVTDAIEQLGNELNITNEDDIITQFLLSEVIREQLQRYIYLLAKHPIKKNMGIVDKISSILPGTHLNNAQRFILLTEALFTTSYKPRSYTASGPFTKKLGEDGVDEFLSLHEQLCEQVEKLHKQHAANSLLELNRAWLSIGQTYLEHYQRIKTEQRLLDFSDLEWKTYQLLNHADNALWIQYKLDERIDHLLIDEFQDTNPTQWHLILPLLNELAAGESDRYRSVFLVGDAKQSIYRFRRANARLFRQASDWLEENLHASRYPLNKSWRSAPAIIDFVNKLFADEQNTGFDFQEHETNKQDLYGRVTLLPLCREIDSNDGSSDNHDELRNPLLEPRPEKENIRFLEEGHLIAKTIQSIIESKLPVEHKGKHYPVTYRDILILFKARTHISFFEQAFRDAGIPYLGADRGTLLESLEVNDMLNLLHWLITPYDNLALAGILKSPLFNASDDDLLLLSHTNSNDWYEALMTVAEPDPPLVRAQKLLNGWLTLAGHVPVHDLLDRIYSEANVIERYKAAFPEHLATRIHANLTRFIELALEMDSGRYPSLTRFTAWIKELKQQRDEAPDAPSETGSDNRITLMTVHSAKGLEAPVVFIADGTYENRSHSSNNVIVEWPVDSQFPNSFMLARKYNFTPDAVSRRLDDEQVESNREDTNLLYVAVTRARQYLYISASQPRRGPALGWYSRIARQHQVDFEELEQPLVLHERGSAPPITEARPHRNIVNIDDNNLNGPFLLTPPCREIAPSRSVFQQPHEGDADEDARLRGVIIHLMLEKLSEQPGLTLQQVMQHFQLAAEKAIIESCWQEAQNVLQARHFEHLFNPASYDKAMNEVSVIYQLGDASVHGIIDRLIINKDKIIIIDYKTHQNAVTDNLALLSESYNEQMALYVQGIKQLWPQHPVEAFLLFTHCAELHKMPQAGQ